MKIAIFTALAMLCPNCSAQQPDASLECSSCGIIFSKFQAKAQVAPEPAAAPAQAVSFAIFPILSVLLAAAWAAMALWPVSASQDASPAQPASPGSALITYRNGEKCVVDSPIFEYTYLRNNNSPNSPIVLLGSWAYSNIIRRENELRVVGTYNANTPIGIGDMREIRFISEFDKSRPHNMLITSVEIVKP